MQFRVGKVILVGVATAGTAWMAMPIATVPAAASPSAARNVDLEGLIEADRDFSRTGHSLDLAAAVSATFDEDVVMVAPGIGFVRGRDKARDVLAANPANARAKAEWAPLTGGISADGKHGFTLGYMRIAFADGSRGEAKYLAYWTRRPQGWRVALYRRKGKAEGAAPSAMLPRSLPDAPGRNMLPAGSRDELLAAERAFSAQAGVVGIGEAFRRFGRPDSINAGSGPGFLVGAEAIAREVADGAGGATLSWAPDDALVAPSGDLGVTWGWIRVEGAPPETPRIPYFTVWRRHSEGWRYAAE